MFNAPRPAQGRYQASNNGNSFGGSFVDENPLASSAYDSLDPWSTASVVVPSAPAQIPGAFSNIIGEFIVESHQPAYPDLKSADATVPAIYHQAFAAVDSGSGDTSVNALIRVLSSSGLPATTVDRVRNQLQ